MWSELMTARPILHSDWSQPRLTGSDVASQRMHSVETKWSRVTVWVGCCCRTFFATGTMSRLQQIESTQSNTTWSLSSARRQQVARMSTTTPAMALALALTVSVQRHQPLEWATRLVYLLAYISYHRSTTIVIIEADCVWPVTSAAVVQWVEWSVSSVTSRVCLSLCPRLKWKKAWTIDTKLGRHIVLAAHRHALILRSKGQTSRSRGYLMRC